MSHNKPNRPQSGRTNLASCIVATIFLIFIAIIILIVFFSLFKPKDPKISVNTFQLPSFTVSNSTVTFTFSQYLSVKNPNRAVFTHYDSSLQLLYSGNQVGFMFIPSGKIDAGRTQFMAATFSVESFPVTVGRDTVSDAVSGVDMGPVLEIQSRMKMSGRVRVLQVFTHHVEGKAECRVAIAVNDGAVLGFHC